MGRWRRRQPQALAPQEQPRPPRWSVEANRRNAAKSTGPLSVEGKAVSSMNALQSGIHAESAIITGEDTSPLNYPFW